MPSREPPAKPINLLKYHRSKLKVGETTVLTRESEKCLRNLVSFHSPKPLLKFPRSRCAAVLVALFAGRSGDLYVLLSRRADTLRAYAGDTSLPGGKVEPGDRTFEDTARREAYEEIGLPPDPKKAPLLCVMEPFVASNQLIVTPVVVLILDKSLTPVLNKAEVNSIFSHPLASFLSSEPPFPSESELLELPYHSEVDSDYTGAPFVGGEKRRVRIHRFLTGREAGGIKPVFGLTAGILIEVAILGYGRRPDFEVQPPGAPTAEERIAWLMWRDPSFRDSCQKEGVRVDLDIVKRLARVDRPLEKPKVRRRGGRLKVRSKL